MRLGAQGLGFGNRLVRLVAGGLGFGNRLGRLVAMGLGFGKPASEASSRGLGFGNRLGRLVAEGLGFGNKLVRLVARGLGFGNQLHTIVVRCIKLAKNSIHQRRAGWTSGLVLGLEERWSWVRILLNLWTFFFFFRVQKISKFFGGLVTGTPSAKFPVPVPVL